MESCQGVNRRPLGQDDLRAICGEPLPESGGHRRAFEVARRLGPLGSLWLEQHVVERARAWIHSYHGAASPDGAEQDRLLRRGEIGILLAMESPGRYPLLRPAFVLPLEWRKGGTSSSRLPQGLAVYAAGVLAELDVRGLSLHLPERFEAEGADFSGLEFSYESAWATLAAGAIVAADNGQTVPDVLASAAWNRRAGQPRGSIGRVQRIGRKIAAAAASGATTLFLPEEQRRLVEKLPPDMVPQGLTLRYLSNALERPARALAPLLHALEAAPRRAAGASFEQRCGYYSRAARERQNDYYCEELLGELVGRLRPSLDREPGLAGVDGVAVIVSPSWSVASLVVELFRPRHVLLLHDGEMPGDVDALITWLRNTNGAGGRRVEVKQCRAREGFSEDLGAAVASCAGRCARVAVDLTAGYRHYMFALLAALPSNAVATYVDAQIDKRYGSVMPQTSELRVLNMGARRS